MARSCRFFLDAGHEQTDLALVRFRIALADDAAAAHDEDAVGKRAHLVELDGYKQDRLARVAHGEELTVDELDRADIDAARRLSDEEHGGISLELAREHDLLLIAAREIRRLQALVRRTDIVLFDLPAGIVAHGPDVEQWSVPERRIVVIAERGVLPFLEGGDEAHAVAILGHVRELAVAQRSRI